MISLIIPATISNSNYNTSIVRNIKDLYPNENEVEIILEINDKVTLGVNYNNAVARAKGEKIILLHNDMVLPKDFIETMDKHISKHVITTYTRIEPPIYMDTYPGKIIKDCGSDLGTFDERLFSQLQFEESLVDGGSQLFFGCMKEDYIGIDGYTFTKFCEDDDLHLRYKLAGFEHKVSSAHVYHFVSKTSRIGDYKQIEHNSNRNFIRKWGFRNSKHNKKYNIGFKMHNYNQSLLELLEVWCDIIWVSENIIEEYIQKEQVNTKYDLRKRVHSIENSNVNDYIDITVEFDAKNFTQNSFNIIQSLSDIITESGEVGQFTLDCFKITIQSLEVYEKNLIEIQ